MGLFKKKNNQPQEDKSVNYNVPKDKPADKSEKKDKGQNIDEYRGTETISKDELKKSQENYQDKKLFDTLVQNVEFIKKMEGESFDFSVREMSLKNDNQQIKIASFYFAGLVDQTFVSDTMYESLSTNFQNLKKELKTQEEIFQYFKDHLLAIAGVSEADKFGDLFNKLLNGDTILLVGDSPKCLIIGSRKMVERGVDQPKTHVSVKGSKDSFNENILTNISLIRRFIRTPNLWVKNYIIGDNSNTNVVVMYIKGIVDENVLAEVDRRLSNIKAGNIIDSAYLKFYLKEKQVSLFPLIYDTERPDTCAANLFEGRVVIICDGSPFALIAPTTFLHSIHSIEDYYEKAVPASFFRLIRFVSFWLAVFIPGVYLTLILFHSELLPLNFLFTVAGQRVDVPLPGFAEIILMALAFDFLREAGIRMPSALGSSLSFVGAIIIGQAAVAAGIVSAIVVIVVTVTGIASLTLTDYDLNLSVTILRYVFMALAAFLGLFGISIGAIVLFAHLVSLRSFGVPYFIPFAPINWGGFKDSFIRMPLGTLLKSKKDPSKKNPY